jgi:hypothetical protein
MGELMILKDGKSVMGKGQGGDGRRTSRKPMRKPLE